MQTIHTKESLATNQRNSIYHLENTVNDRDEQFCNLYTQIIALSRRTWQPVAGDTIIIDGKRAHIDTAESYTAISANFAKKPVGMIKLGVCYQPMTPFIRATLGDSSAKLSLSTSGGPWDSIEIESQRLVLTGQEQKFFCFFGHSGARANGAIDFDATINVWEITKK